MSYDVIVVGSGPGGYVTAIRAAQLGYKAAIVERESLGGICLNWGCIPTKALIKSAEVFDYISHSEDFGVTIDGEAKADFEKIIKRSRGVADKMSKGIQFLMRKNKIDVIDGTAKLSGNNKIEVKDDDEKTDSYEAKHIILATGARSRELPSMPIDGKKIIGYREAMNLPKQPKSMIIVGSGAIGVEFAYFYNSIGTKVTIVEYMDRIVPVEDKDVSKELKKAFKKKGIEVMTSSAVTKADTSGDGVKATVETKKGDKTLEADILLSAAGVSANIENIGLEALKVETEKGKVKVDDYYKTNVDGIYAIGDMVPGQALAHVAMKEGVICIENIAKQEGKFDEQPEPLDYKNVPGCTYCSPEIASVGLTEEQAKEAGYDLKVGKFPFTASGKASASGANEGFIKVIFDAKYGEWLGAHLIGEHVTEIISEAVTARKLETTYNEQLDTIFPHPTMSEAMKDAIEVALGQAIHI